MDSPRSDKLYWPQLDGLRALAFLLVFINHLPPLPMDVHHPPIGWGMVALVLFGLARVWGWIGVEVFFVLSAFLITSILLRERERCGDVSFRRFFIRRMLRIWPLYYLMGLLAFLVFPLLGYQAPLLGSPSWQEMMRAHALPYLLFLFNFSLPTSLPLTFIVIAWSVTMEEQFYIVWGWCMARFKKRSALYLIAGIALAVGYLARQHLQAQSADHLVFYYNTLSHLDPIVMGIVLALLMQSGRLQPESLRAYGWLLFALPVLFYIYLMFLEPSVYANQPSIVPVFSFIALFAGMLLLSLFAWEPARRFFSSPLITHMGRLTYGTYFLHVLAIEIVTPWAKALFQGSGHIYQAWLLGAAVSLLLTFLLALVSWHLLEKHFYRMRHRFASVQSGFE